MWVARARRIARDSAEVTVHCLEIAVRTAKFHQASILKKLDVDSRLDLLRLLL
jgi:DNA-binding CsgD family transcriptional regulator